MKLNDSVFTGLFPMKLCILFEYHIIRKPVQKHDMPRIVISNFRRQKPYRPKIDMFIYEFFELSLFSSH